MSPRALANLEREQHSQKAQRLLRSTLMMFATILSFSAVSLFVLDRLYQPDTFVINQLKIKGKFQHIKPATIERIVNGYPLSNFFSIELRKIKQDIQQLNWVDQADVRREWPNTLVVHVREHTPLMTWNRKKATNSWVTQSGDVVQLESVGLPDSTIHLSGDEEDAQTLLQAALRWDQQLMQHDLKLRAVSLSASQSWRLTMSQEHIGSSQASFELLLGREHVEDRLSRFTKLYQDQLSQRNDKLIRVDARYPNGVAVQATDTKSSEVTPS